jgi:hypothetical protein
VGEEWRRLHSDIRHHARVLIGVANRAEAVCSRGGAPQDADEPKAALAQTLVASQGDAVLAILRGCSHGLDFDHVVRGIVEPVLDEEVVGEVASIAINQVIDTARKHVLYRARSG